MTEASVAARIWAGRAFWAVTDQGLFSVSNFGLNLLLARWLSAEEYGRFVIAFTAFLLISTVHTAILSEPMLVFGPGRYRERLPEYLRVVISGHWLMMSAVAGVLGVTALVALLFRSRELAYLLAALAVATPLILFQWLARRACYTRLRPQLATAAGTVYAILIALGLYGLLERHWLTAWSALLLMGAASFVATFWLMIVLRVHRSGHEDHELPPDVRRNHWAYGRWAVGVNALTWVPGNAYALALPLWGGVGGAGALVALFTFVTPMMQFMAALGVLLLPSMAQARARGDVDALVQPLLRGFLLAGLAYWLCVGLGGRWLIQAVYQGKYAELHSSLWLIGLVPISSGAITVLGAALRAAERADTIFWAYVTSSIATLTLGLLLTARLGVMGSAIGLAVCYTITAGALLRSYHRMVVREPTRGVSSAAVSTALT